MSGWPRRGDWRERPARYVRGSADRPTDREIAVVAAVRAAGSDRVAATGSACRTDREAPPGRRAVQAVGDDRWAARVDPGGCTARIAEHLTRLAWRNPLMVMSRTQRRAG